MNTNECLNQIHSAIIAKVKSECEVSGNNKLALEIGSKLAEYGSSLAASFGNDGKIDEKEERILNAKFDTIINTYLPKKDGIIVDKAWNGFSFCLIKVFKGVKNYLNEWFGLCMK